MIGDTLIEAIRDALNGTIGTLPGSATEGAAIFIDHAPANAVEGGGPFRGQSYDAAASIVLAKQAAGSAVRSAIQAQVMAVANAPGEKILPGELARGLRILADGGEIDYEGATGFELTEVGEVPGTCREMEVEGGAFVTKTLHWSGQKPAAPSAMTGSQRTCPQMGDDLHKHPAVRAPGRVRTRRSSRAWAAQAGQGGDRPGRGRSSPCTIQRRRCARASRSLLLLLPQGLCVPFLRPARRLVPGYAVLCRAVRRRRRDGLERRDALSRRRLQARAQRVAVVGHELGMKAGAADLHVEGLLGGQMDVLRLHRRDHPVHGAALERVHRGRPGPVDMAQLGIVPAQRQRPAVLQTERNRGFADRRHFRRAAVHQPVRPVVPGPAYAVAACEAPWRPRRRPPPRRAAPPALRVPRRPQRRACPGA